MTMLTLAERERMTKLLQELLEAAKEITKALEHGFEATDGEGNVYNNRTAIEQELGDVMATLNLCVDRDDLCQDRLLAFAEAKVPEVTRYMHYQGTENAQS